MMAGTSQSQESCIQATSWGCHSALEPHCPARRSRNPCLFRSSPGASEAGGLETGDRDPGPVHVCPSPLLMGALNRGPGGAFRDSRLPHGALPRQHFIRQPSIGPSSSAKPTIALLWVLLGCGVPQSWLSHVIRRRATVNLSEPPFPYPGTKARATALRW